VVEWLQTDNFKALHDENDEII